MVIAPPDGATPPADALHYSTQAPRDERAAIAALAQKCLDAKGQGPQVKQWEAEIDERVARLYRLSAADLKAIKGE